MLLRDYRTAHERSAGYISTYLSSPQAERESKSGVISIDKWDLIEYQRSIKNAGWSRMEEWNGGWSKYGGRAGQDTEEGLVKIRLVKIQGWSKYGARAGQNTGLVKIRGKGWSKYKYG